MKITLYLLGGFTMAFFAQWYFLSRVGLNRLEFGEYVVWTLLVLGAYIFAGLAKEERERRSSPYSSALFRRR